MRWLRSFLPLLAFLAAPWLGAAEVMPPSPRDHFNDYAGIVRREVAQQLNNELIQFERDTSNQLVVVVFPKMQSPSSIEDYTVRLFQSWGVGTKEKKNGAVLFVFRDDRKLRIVTGYGLEGVLPDALCKQIIENEITPRFRAGDFTAGLAAGTRAMIAAAKGEYRGTGRTVADARNGARRGNGGFPIGLLVPAFVVLFVVGALLRALGRGRRSILYNGRGRTIWTAPTIWGSSGGSGWSGGGGGGGGGSFSGGGGSTGGGGAGGSW